MKFADKIERDDLDIVYVLRTKEDMESRDEYNSNIWNLVRENKMIGKNLYETPARDVKIGESIYYKNMRYLTTRLE